MQNWILAKNEVFGLASSFFEEKAGFSCCLATGFIRVSLFNAQKETRLGGECSLNTLFIKTN
jgi:hypothetical protein